jgi:hypothetical protein
MAEEMGAMKSGSNLERVLTAGEFAATAEIGPPMDRDATVVLKKAEVLKGVADAYNITDNFPWRDARTGRMERTVPGMRRVHIASDRRHMSGRPLREKPVQWSLRRILQREVRGKQRHGLCLAVDHRPFEGARPIGEI